MVVKYLVLAFKNEAGNRVNLSVKNVKDNPTAAEIAAAMDVIIGKNAFFSSGGKLVDKLGAQIITKNVDEFELA